MSRCRALHSYQHYKHRESHQEKGVFQEDEFDTFVENDIISTLHDLNETSAPAGFQLKRFEDNVLYYNIVFHEQTQFPTILESIKVDRELHVQRQYNGMPLLLPQWFVQGHNAKLKRISMLINFPSYIGNTAVENHNSILKEPKERQFYRPNCRTPYSAEMIRYSLHLRYTSLQAYKLIIGKFPMPSISLLNRIHQLKALKPLREK